MKMLFSTYNSFSLFIIRITLGIVMFPHGAQKALGFFGGHGFHNTIEMFTKMQMPAALAVLVIASEFLGSLGLIFGCVTRIAALGIGAVMIGAIATVHYKNGFFMNWMGNQSGEGFEYHILVLGMVVALIISGGGKWSIDRCISEKLNAGE